MPYSLQDLLIKTCVEEDLLKEANKLVSDWGLQDAHPNVGPLYRQKTFDKMLSKRVWKVAAGFALAHPELQATLFQISVHLIFDHLSAVVRLWSTNPCPWKSNLQIWAPAGRWKGAVTCVTLVWSNFHETSPTVWHYKTSWRQDFSNVALLKALIFGITSDVSASALPQKQPLWFQDQPKSSTSVPNCFVHGKPLPWAVRNFTRSDMASFSPAWNRPADREVCRGNWS